MSTWTRKLALAVSAAALAACGGGGSDGPAATANPNYFPLDSGNRWVSQEAGKALPRVVRTTGPDSVQGVSGIGMHSYDPNDGSTDDSVFVASANSLRVYSKPTPTSAIEALTDGLELLRLPATPGSSHVLFDRTIDSGIDFDLDTVTDQATFRSVATVVGTETLTTRAGTFTDCLHVRAVMHTVYTYSSGAPAPVFDSATDYWYAPNIGLVKITSTTTGTTLTAPIETAEELVAYRVGSRTTDAVAPAVTAIAPATGSTVGAGAQVQATFDEALDGESVNPALLRVLDGSGQAVAGNVVAEGTVLRFVNTQPWSPGIYTVELAAGVPDLLGNTSTQGRSVTFTVN